MQVDSEEESVLELRSLTQVERLALPSAFNLADGHARSMRNSRMRALLTDSFDVACETPQDELESDFLEVFLSAGHQSLLRLEQAVFLSYSASSAIEIVASLCQRRGLRVGLIEPVFDNIPRILQYRGIPLVSITEDELGDVGAPGALSELDVLWLVMPNNPTSWQPSSESAFREIVRVCEKRGILLVLDFCFRQYSTTMLGFDQYAVLRSSKCSYIAIEDTGKTWGSYEIKVGVTVSSLDVSEDLQLLHENLLLRVSPVHLAFLIRLISDPSHLTRTQEVVRENRRSAKSSLEDRGFYFESSNRHDWALPLEWMKLPETFDRTALQFSADLALSLGVQVLAGEQFYWSDPVAGERYLRIALNREPRMFADAMRLICAHLRTKE